MTSQGENHEDGAPFPISARCKIAALDDGMSHVRREDRIAKSEFDRLQVDAVSPTFLAISIVPFETIELHDNHFCTHKCQYNAQLIMGEAKQ